MLEVAANSKLSVETYYSVFRPFPPSFQPDPRSDLVMEWEWRIADTELSGAVGIVVVRTEPDGSLADNCFGVDGFTQFTSNWAVLFDPPGRWLRHRLAMNPDHCEPRDRRPKVSVGIDLIFVSPVRQVVSLAALRVEEWLPGSFTSDPVFRPHPAPPPEARFAPRPIDQLRRATAGAAEDLDGDGLPELLILERRGYAHLYRNTNGLDFEEITERAGLAQPTMGTGAMFVDLDADGDRDLLLTSEFDVPRFFENRGNLRFRERRGLDARNLSFWYSAAVEDVDRDGDPDLLFISPKQPSVLFLRNRGAWRFTPEPLLGQPEVPLHETLDFSASFGDFDGDGWPDLFLGREKLFRNIRGRFQRVLEPWSGHSPVQTEGGVWAELTGDRHLDLLILRDPTESPTGRTRLLAGRGTAFEEITEGSGIPPLESAEVALAEDFDNDGDLDLYLCQRNRPNYLLLNDGRGRFTDGTERSGFSETGGCDSALATDLDGDGGLDLLILRNGSPPALLRNQLERGRWLGVRLQGRPGSDAIGAKVEIFAPGGEAIAAIRVLQRGSGFGSVGPAELRFGLGSRLLADVEVRFPSGITRRLRAVRAGSTQLVVEEDRGNWSLAWSRFLEARDPWIRSFRRLEAYRWPLAALIAGIAFLLTFVGRSKLARPLALVLLVVGAFLAWALGTTPGRGFSASPPALWGFGALAGFLVPLGVAGLRRAAGLLRVRSQSVPPPIEELVRFTHDFRHSALERNALLSIQSRAVNLFPSAEPHSTFLAALRELAAQYPRTTGARLRELLALGEAAFPGLAESAKLARAERSLGELLGELPQLGAEPEPLRRWQRALMPALTATKETLEALVGRFDQLASCDVSAVVREVDALQAERLARADVVLELDLDLDESPQLALITRDALLLILENLISNSLTSLGGEGKGRLGIALHRTGDRVVLRFRDDGPGVPAELEEAIFQYGFSTRPAGKGYGLPRSREILGHFGGGIVLEPSLEKGAVFMITLLRVPARLP